MLGEKSTSGQLVWEGAFQLMNGVLDVSEGNNMAITNEFVWRNATIVDPNSVLVLTENRLVP